MNLILRAIGINAILSYVTALLKNRINAKVTDERKKQVMIKALEAIIIFLKALLENPNQLEIFCDVVEDCLKELHNAENQNIIQ